MNFPSHSVGTTRQGGIASSRFQLKCEKCEPAENFVMKVKLAESTFPPLPAQLLFNQAKIVFMGEG